MTTEDAPALSMLIRDWRFVPSRPTLKTIASRAKSLVTGVRFAPRRVAIIPVAPRKRWNCFFMFLPGANVTDAHRYTIDRLRRLPGGLLLICAADKPERIPSALLQHCDALYWKALSGYDFSAYAIALSEVALRSPFADLFVMNDSVYGPFCDIEPRLSQSQCDLLGFTATSAIENHIQSYAFYLRKVTMQDVNELSSVASLRFAFDRFQDVVNLQETRFARIANRRSSIEALWYSPIGEDPSLKYGPILVDEGFPFLKRSLAGRYKHLHGETKIRKCLAEKGHPL